MIRACASPSSAYRFESRSINAFDAELLHESLELAQRRGSLVQIDEMRLDPSLGEKPQRLSGVGAFLHAEDLNFHRLRRTLFEVGHL